MGERRTTRGPRSAGVGNSPLKEVVMCLGKAFFTGLRQGSSEGWGDRGGLCVADMIMAVN